MSLRASLKLCLSAILICGASLAAHADSTFVLSNTNGGDGYVTVSGNSFQLFGSNNGSQGNFTTYTSTFSTATVETFSWSYTTADCCGSGWDPAGYVLNGVFTQVSTDYFGGAGLLASSGIDSILVPAGGTFGWYVSSPDSLLGRGELAVSTSASAVAPEPGSLVLVGTGILSTLGLLRRKAKI